jgi:beta-glucosidase-like glycosyl hydrolase
MGAAACASAPPPPPVRTAAPGPGAPGAEVRVLVYNIRAGHDVEGVGNLERVARLVRSTLADVVLLQEVDSATARSGGVDQLAELEGRTGYHGAFGRTLDYQGGGYGIAVLSRWPIVADTLHPLRVEPAQERAGGSYEPRGAQSARLDGPGGALGTVNTHLDASPDDRYRRQEVAGVLAVAERLRADDAMDRGGWGLQRGAGVGDDRGDAGRRVDGRMGSVRTGGRTDFFHGIACEANRLSVPGSGADVHVRPGPRGGGVGPPATAGRSPELAMTARLLAALIGAGMLAVACSRPVPPTTAASPADGRAGADQPLRATERDWVETTLASLSLREKVGQLVMPWVGGEYTAVDSPEFDRLLEWVESQRVGGLILSVGLPHSYAAKLNELQRRAEVPLLVASDMENGPGMRLSGIYSLPHLLPQGGGTAFPPVMALGATGSEQLAYELGRVLGREARAVGVHITFGPVLDVNSNPANPIINTRSFGEDPELVSRLGVAYIRGARAEGLMTTAKHFPGHGDTSEDSHIELPVITADRARLDSVELPPFRAAVDAGIDGVMTAHIALPGVEGEGALPATLSPYFMSEVLRGEMGFAGLLFTDAMTMGGVVDEFGGGAEVLVRALEAGADILLMPRDVAEAVNAVVHAVETRRVTESRIDASVRRLLEAKARAGLHQGREVSLVGVDRVVGRARPHRPRRDRRRALPHAAPGPPGARAHAPIR